MMLHDVAIFIKRHEGWTGMKNDPSMLQISLNKSLWRLSVTATHLAHVCWGKDGEASQKKDTVFHIRRSSVNQHQYTMIRAC